MRSGPIAIRPRAIRLITLAVVPVLAALSQPSVALAQNIAKVVRARIGPTSITAAWKDLDLDLSTIQGGLRSYSIAPGEITEIELTVIVEETGTIGATIMDEDTSETLRGWDDELEFRISGGEPAAGDTVHLHMFCGCDPDADDVHSGGSSGEQSAEIYILAGKLRIPAGPGWHEGDTRGSYWQIDCDKEASESMLVPRDTLQSFWGDALIFPDGALTSNTTVGMANMYPLLDAQLRPSGFGPISEALVLQPDQLSLAVPATLVFRYSLGEVGDIADENTLRVFRYDSVSHWWSLVPGSVVNPADHTLRVPIGQLGTYGFAAETPQLTPLSHQMVGTDFGDNTLGLRGFANGSELDELSAVARGEWLYLYFGGNLESNFNKLELFFDTGPGGQNRLRGDNPPIDFDGLNRMGDDGSGNGLTFDPDFAADYWIGLTGGDAGGGEYRLHANYATLPTGGGGTAAYLGETGEASSGVLDGGTNPFRIAARINNSNTAGVPSGCYSVSSSSIPSGMELAIPLQALGYASGCIKVSAFINGSSHAYVSNQALGPLPPGTCNLGEPRYVNFGGWSGNQFVEVCSLSVVSVQQPNAAPRARLEVWPNPSYGSVTISFDGWSPGDWSVEVFDVTGRRVKRFAPAVFASGRLVWDGATASGARAPAGLYMVRLRRADFEETARFLLLR
jgi:hypothetical protein